MAALLANEMRVALSHDLECVSLDAIWTANVIHSEGDFTRTEVRFSLESDHKPQPGTSLYFCMYMHT